MSGKQKGFKNVRCGCKQDGGKASGKQKGFKNVRCGCKQDGGKASGKQKGFKVVGCKERLVVNKKDFKMLGCICFICKQDGGKVSGKQKGFKRMSDVVVKETAERRVVSKKD